MSRARERKREEGEQNSRTLALYPQLNSASYGKVGSLRFRGNDISVRETPLQTREIVHSCLLLARLIFEQHQARLTRVRRSTPPGDEKPLSLAFPRSLPLLPFLEARFFLTHVALLLFGGDVEIARIKQLAVEAARPLGFEYPARTDLCNARVANICLYADLGGTIVLDTNFSRSVSPRNFPSSSPVVVLSLFYRS